MKNKILIMFLLICSFIFSDVVDTSLFIKAEKYNEAMTDKVEPYLENIKTSGYFLGSKSKNIYYETFKVKEAKGTIVLVHGFGEYIEKYNEIIYYLTKNGYNVYALEHRDHSRSDNVWKNSNQIYVEDYDYYIDDLKTFVDKIVKPSSDKLYLFAHSMGGAIGTVFLERYPQYFEKAVLDAPMLEINLGKTPKSLLKLNLGLKVLFGKGTDFVPGEKPFSSEYNFRGSSTSSKERYDYSYKKVVGNKVLQNGGASIKWLNEALEMTSEATKKGNISKVKAKVLIFQAGNDSLVKAEGQNKFAKYASDAKLVYISKAKHEIYRESDEILYPYMIALLDFYNK